MPQKTKANKSTQASIPRHLYLALFHQASIKTRKKYGLLYNTVLLFAYYCSLEYLGYELTKRRVKTVFMSFSPAFIKHYTEDLLKHGLLVIHPGIHKYTSIPYDYYTISDLGLTILSEIEDGFYMFYRKVVEKRI